MFQKYFSSNLQQSSAAKQPRKHGVGFQTPDSVASCRLRVRCRVESVVWGQGLCREKSLNPSPAPGPDCWQLHGLQHYTAGRGRGEYHPTIQHVGKPVTTDRGVLEKFQSLITMYLV